MNAHDLMREFRLFFDSGDPWGSTMGWWFAVAAEMWERGLDISDAWQYRPSPLGAIDPDAYETPIVAEATDDGLRLFGRVLNRYAVLLKKAGRSY